MFRHLLFVFITVITFTSCRLDNNNECFSISPAGISTIDGPSTATVNQPVSINMTFMVGNGCGSYYSTENFSEGDTTEVLVKVKFQGCMCTQQVMTLQQTYTFTPTVPGPHYFKYFVSDGNYLRDTIWVQ